MSSRQIDMRGEKALGLFLDEFFYPRLCEIEGFTRTERVYDADMQKKGCDIYIFNKGGRSIKIDEKAQLHFINDPRDTFVFEISFLQDDSGEVMNGWFVSDNNITDCYMLSWIDQARTDKINRIVADDFEQVTICFITKKKVISYLAACGYSLQSIKTMADEMRKNGQENKAYISTDAILYYSRVGYPEQPINILISRSVLCRLSYGVYVVSREGVIKETNTAIGQRKMERF